MESSLLVGLRHSMEKLQDAIAALDRLEIYNKRVAIESYPGKKHEFWEKFEEELRKRGNTIVYLEPPRMRQRIDKFGEDAEVYSKVANGIKEYLKSGRSSQLVEGCSRLSKVPLNNEQEAVYTLRLMKFTVNNRAELNSLASTLRKKAARAEYIALNLIDKVRENAFIRRIKEEKPEVIIVGFAYLKPIKKAVGCRTVNILTLRDRFPTAADRKLIFAKTHRAITKRLRNIKRFFK